MRKGKYTNVNLGATPQTLSAIQRVLSKSGREVFMKPELFAEIKYEDVITRDALSMRIERLLERGWLGWLTADDFNLNFFLSKKAKDYIRRWGSFENPEAPLMMSVRRRCGELPRVRTVTKIKEVVREKKKDYALVSK